MEVGYFGARLSRVALSGTEYIVVYGLGVRGAVGLGLIHTSIGIPYSSLQTS